MTEFTANWGLPHPSADEAPDGPTQIADLAEYLDSNPHGRVLMGDQGALADRPAAADAAIGQRWLTRGDPDPSANNIEWIRTATGGWVALRGDVPDGSIGTAKLADDAVTRAKIGPAAVGPDELDDGSVNAAGKLADGIVTAAKVADALKPSAGAAAGTEALRALGVTGVTAAAGNDPRLADQRVPQDGSVGTAKIIDKAVTAAKIADALKPSAGAAAGTESLRALGATASTAAAGNDPRLADQRVPQDGSVTDAKVAAGAAIAASKLASFGRPVIFAVVYDETQVGANSEHVFVNQNVAMPRGGNLFLIALQWGYDVRGGNGAVSLNFYVEGGYHQGQLMNIDAGRQILLANALVVGVAAGNRNIQGTVQNYNNPVTWQPRGSFILLGFNTD